MNKIDERLIQLKKEKRLGLMTHVVVGYPSVTQTIEIVKVMDQLGVDFVELQIPFSDPLADGPTIMKASEQALNKGTRVKDAFTVAQKLITQISTPLLFMAYYNTVFKYGVAKFCSDAKAVGISGLIIPDIPLEEESEEHFMRNCEKNDLFAIRLVSPSSTVERLQKNSQLAQGFVYCISRQGITGAKKGLAPQVVKYLKTVRKEFKVPLAVGFGISSAERVNLIRPFCDVVIVGSAIIDVISASKPADLLQNVSKFIKGLGV